jgi:cation transport regulator ChaB
MPYRTNDDLPEAVRGKLPAAAQGVFRAAFNSAHAKDPDEGRASATAWAAVKGAGYGKGEDGAWVKKSADLVSRLLTSGEFDALLAQVTRPAPGYRPSDTLVQCQHCAQASPGNMCATYNFRFTPSWVCDTYQPGVIQAFKGAEMRDRINIVKTDEEQRLVFGFFSINRVGESLVEDLQGDLIETAVLEKAAYAFVLDARVAGETHVRKGVGRLVESVMLTYEKQEAIRKCLEAQGIQAEFSLGCEGWFGGFRVDDDGVWAAIKAGDYPAFSIGGSGTREPIKG